MLEAHTIHFHHAGGAPLLRGASLRLAPGRVLGLSGASGCGKSTLGRILAGHWVPQSGSIRLGGAPLPRRGLSPVQWLAQSAALAVNPQWRIGRILEEAYHPSASQRAAFGIRDSWLRRYPHELSGGELQRVAILRALAPGVGYLVADEISAMLDPLAQAELWSLLLRQGLGILAISHSAALLQRVADEIVTLEAGEIRPRPMPG
jgi:ABC-type dipeptide/oligopeptide/nickel transport system ATPase subunit